MTTPQRKERAMAMGKGRVTISGDEVDVVYARKHLKWRRGEVAGIKRQMRRRERQEGKRETRNF